MTLTILFAAATEGWKAYESPLHEGFKAAGLDVRLTTDCAPESVDYIIYAPNSTVQDFGPFTRLKAVLNLWAGVEHVTSNPTLTVPLARMVDDSLTRGMVEWVTGHVLRHHLGMDAHIHGLGGAWKQDVPPLARDRRVTILGLGALGRACAESLVFLGFDTAGWSRSPKTISGMTCYSGDEGLEHALRRAEFLVLLLPNTQNTRYLMNTQTLAQLPAGAVILNPGRGALINDTDLLSALESGHIAHATLDTFQTEPLPPEHPYWSHPSVTVTPHIAAETRASSAAQVIVENVRRSEAGEPLLYLVDRAKGY